MLPNIIAIIIGTALTIALCEVLRLIIRITRFKIWYTVAFIVLSIFVPSFVYVAAFPYFGALSGMSYIYTYIASFAGVIFCIGSLCLGVLRDTEIKRRFITCVITFLVISVSALYYFNSTIPHVRIE